MKKYNGPLVESVKTAMWNVSKNTFCSQISLVKKCISFRMTIYTFNFCILNPLNSKATELS